MKIIVEKKISKGFYDVHIDFNIERLGIDCIQQVPGVENAVLVERYTISVLVAKCFEPTQVLQDVETMLKLYFNYKSCEVPPSVIIKYLSAKN